MTIRTTRADDVLRIRIDRPEAMNALSATLLTDLTAAMVSASDDRTIRAVVVAGSPVAFCAGMDLGPRRAEGSAAESALDDAGRLIETMVAMPQPVVALVRGPAVGLGASIAVAADVTVMSADAYLALPMTGIGLMPDAGATSLFAASAGRATAMRMALLGERLTADDAVRAGLAATTCPGDEFDATADAIVGRLADLPPAALAATKAAVNAASTDGLAAALVRERAGQLHLLAGPGFVAAMSARARRRGSARASGSATAM